METRLDRPRQDETAHSTKRVLGTPEEAPSADCPSSQTCNSRHAVRPAGTERRDYRAASSADHSAGPVSSDPFLLELSLIQVCRVGGFGKVGFHPAIGTRVRRLAGGVEKIAATL